MTNPSPVNEMPKGNAVFVLEFSKTVQYWNDVQGANVKKDGTQDSGHWMVDVSHLNGRLTADPEQTFADQLANYLSNRVDYKQKYLAIMEDGRVSFNRIENADGEEVAHGEDRGTQLYLSEYDCHITETYEFTPTQDRLAQLLPDAEL